ncbi:MAG: hypothetical protein ACQEWZ_00170 [Pseudomonadota bacterium]
MLRNKLERFKKVYGYTAAEFILAMFFGFFSIFIGLTYAMAKGGEGASIVTAFSDLALRGDFAIASVGIFGPVIASIIVTPPPVLRLVLLVLSIIFAFFCVVIYTISIAGDGLSRSFYDISSLGVVIFSCVLLLVYYFVRHMSVDPVDKQKKESDKFVSGYENRKTEEAVDNA